MSLQRDTVENVLQIVSDYRGESSTNTDADRIRAVSRAEQDFAGRRFWRIFLLRNQTQSGNGGSDYTIGSASYPMRPKGLCEVYVGGQTEDKRYSIIDYQRYQNLINRDSAVRVAYEWFDAANDLWKVHINPAPTASDTIYTSHFWLPPKRTAKTDYVFCPNMRILALLALGDLYDKEEELQKSQLAKQEAEQLIDEQVGFENAPAVNQLYTFAPGENLIRQYTIGEY